MILLVRFFSLVEGAERGERKGGRGGGEGGRGQAMKKKILGERRLDKKAGEVRGGEEWEGRERDGYLDW